MKLHTVIGKVVAMKKSDVVSSIMVRLCSLLLLDDMLFV